MHLSETCDEYIKENSHSGNYENSIVNLVKNKIQLILQLEIISSTWILQSLM